MLRELLTVKEVQFRVQISNLNWTLLLKEMISIYVKLDIPTFLKMI
ncbi:unnamed protein product [Musa textilis]